LAQRRVQPEQRVGRDEPADQRLAPRDPRAEPDGPTEPGEREDDGQRRRKKWRDSRAAQQVRDFPQRRTPGAQQQVGSDEIEQRDRRVGHREEPRQGDTVDDGRGGDNLARAVVVREHERGHEQRGHRDAPEE